MTIKILFSDQVGTWTMIGAIATFLAVVVALFGEKFRNWIFGPRLVVLFGNQYPYFRYHPKIQDPQNEIRNSAGYYIQLKVTNAGHSTAHVVYGKLIKFTYKLEDEIWELFDPTILEWNCTKECKPQNLSPNDYDFLNLCFILPKSPLVYIKTDYELRGLPFGFNIKDQPFKITIALYSDNAPTIEKTYLLSFGDEKKFAENNKLIAKKLGEIACANIEEIKDN